MQKSLRPLDNRSHINQLPTTLALPNQAIDRLRAAAATIIFNSPDLWEALKDKGARIVDRPLAAPMATPSAPTRPAAPPATE